MTLLLKILGGAISLALLVLGVVQWIRGRASALRDLAVAEANESAERTRVNQMDAAEADARAAREGKFNEKADAARTAADAARLLCDVSGDPPTR